MLGKLTLAHEMIKVGRRMRTEKEKLFLMQEQDRRMCKGEDFSRLGPDRSPFAIVANDNFAQDQALAA
jgi:hypothetical protein